MTELQSRIERLSAEHAILWRQISMSPEWRQLQRVEAQIDLLREIQQPAETEPAESATEPSNLSGENL